MANPLNRPRKSPQQERSSDLVSAIYEASVRIFDRDGQTKFSTRTVAEIAGISVGSLYQYFPNKEALIGALIERESRKHLTQLEQKYEEIKDRDLEVVVRMVIGEILSDIEKNRYFLRGILKSIFNVERLDTVIQNRKRAFEFITKIILDKKIVADPEEAKAKAYIITASVGGIIETLIFRDEEVLSLEHVIEETVQMVIAYCKNA